MKKKLLSLLLVTAMVLSMVPFAFAAAPALQAADALHALGLFQGTGADENGAPVYALDRTPSRQEALTMLVRVLGEEKAARSAAYVHPFSDVSPWADTYVGYAYNTGLTKGVSATSFGDGNVDAAQYLTFMLRALGYSDTAGDFSWSNPFSLATQVGIIPQETNLVDFRRADVALISYAALSAKLKGSDQTLAQKLLSAQAFAQAQYDALFSGAGQGGALTATQISEKCAPAVFYIETYAINGAFLGTGSGFLISSDGLAVTNYHVVADAYDVLAKTTDGTVYRLLVLDGSYEDDLALVKLDGGGAAFPYLELNTTAPVVQGQTVYAIGSPQGLDNTLSQGIVSNPSRVLDDTDYIQISVPIAPGSSGGALLNEAGQVIGVTSAGFLNSTGDLNLAIPARKLSVLDYTATEDSILFSLEPYPVADYVPDFGIFSGTRLIDQYGLLQVGSDYTYDMMDFYPLFDMDEGERYAEAIYQYQQTLLDLSFTLESEEEDRFTYTSDTESVLLVLNYDDLQIEITSLRHLLYYAEVDVVDFGWCIGLESAPATMVNGSYMWAYPWRGYYTDEEVYGMFEDYQALMGARGFTLWEEDGFYFCDNQDYSVALSKDDRNIYVDILPKGTPSYGSSYSTTSSPPYSSSYAFPLHLYSNDGKTYLGKLVTSTYDMDSVWNPYGTYGSKYSSCSIWNTYGVYGSKYASTSAFNSYALSPPKIVDDNGKFFGYLTTNKYTIDGYTIEELSQFLKKNNQ